MDFAQADVEVARRVVAAGYEIATVYDIGASNGGWTREMRPALPGAHFELSEPLGDTVDSYREGLDRLIAADPGVRVNVGAVAAAEGAAVIRRFDQPVGSTLIVGYGDEPKVSIPQWSVDTLVASGRPVPDLLKADTQGSELEILKGAVNTLELITFLLLETWLVRGYGPATPPLGEVSPYLYERGFVTFDIGGGYRTEENAIALDVWFLNVRKSREKSWYYTGVPS